MASRPLARLFPPPRRVTLAGRAFLVEELTLGERAEVDAPREARRPDPLGPVRGLLWGDAVPPAERDRFNLAFELAEDPPDPGPRTPADLAEEALAFVRVALRRHHPEVARGDGALLDILEAATAGELEALREAAYRPDPMLILCRSLDRHCGTEADDGGEEADWWELVDRVARSHAIPYAEVARMTGTQFCNALAEGKAVEGRQARPGEDAVATHRKWTRWLAGEDVTDG